jgi:hypothetical protein
MRAGGGESLGEEAVSVSERVTLGRLGSRAARRRRGVRDDEVERGADGLGRNNGIVPGAERGRGGWSSAGFPGGNEQREKSVGRVDLCSRGRSRVTGGGAGTTEMGAGRAVATPPTSRRERLPATLRAALLTFERPPYETFCEGLTRMIGSEVSVVWPGLRAGSTVAQHELHAVLDLPGAVALQ